MQKLKRCLVMLLALVLVAGITLRVGGTVFVVGSNICADPNNPTVLETVIIDEGGSWSKTISIIDPDGIQGVLTATIVSEAIANLSLSPPLTLDPNTVSFVGKVSPCDFSPIDPNQVAMASVVLSFEPRFGQAGFYLVDILFSDGAGGESLWRYEITVRSVNRIPFPLDLLGAEGGE